MVRRLHRFLKSEQLESRRPLAADLAALDVNDDMSVTALDALIVINEINQQSKGNVASAEAEGELNCDTNSDGVVSPVDVLTVINQINSGVVTVTVDTADPTTSQPVDPVTTPDDTTNSGVVTTPVDGVDVTSPSDPVTDDPTTDDSDNSDPTDDSTDSSDPVDETDGTDGGDVVNQPTDGTEDGSSGDSTDDDSTDDDSTDDDSTDDDSTDDNTDGDAGTGDDSECDHGERADRAARVMHELHHGHDRPRGRGDIFDDLDANGDGALTSDEVPDRLWNHLSEADTDSSGSVTEEELIAYREAQHLAAVEAFFDQLDTDSSGTITSAEVSRLAWRILSRADSNEDGAITVDELMAVPLPRH